MKFLLETVSLCLLVILVAVDAGFQHHFAKRNNIQIREIHVPHPRLRRVYLLQHGSKNYLESHDNSEKDEVEVLPAKRKYDSTKEITSVPHVKVTTDTVLEVATTSLPKEELELTTSVSDKELPNVTLSKEFESTSLLSDVKEPELPSVVPNEEVKQTSNDIKNPVISDKVPNKKIKSTSLSDVKEPELPKENEEQKILTEHHRKRRGGYYLNTQYVNEKKVQTPLTFEDAVIPSKLEQSTIPSTTELHDEITPLSMDLDKTKPDPKNPEKIAEDKTKPESKNPIIAVEENIIDDDVQKPSESETKNPATEDEKKVDETKVEKTVQEVEVKEEETIQRKKRDLYNFNLKQKEEKNENKKKTLELNKPYIPLKTDKEKTSLLDDKLNNVETSTPKSLDIHKEQEEDLANAEKTKQTTPLDIKKKKQVVSSEIKQGIDNEPKIKETTTLEPIVDQSFTLAEVESISTDIIAITPMPEEKPKVELSAETRQKRDKYSFLKVNNKLKVEENALSSTDTKLKDEENFIKDEISILQPVIESLTSSKTNEEPKTENIPIITKTNYKKKDDEALLPVSEEEKETEVKQKVEKLPAEIQTEDKQKPENSLDKNGSEKISASSESEYEKKETNQITESSQPSNEKAVEKRKKRNSYKYFHIKEEQKQPQLPEDESVQVITLENKVEEVTVSSVEKVTELNTLTTAKEKVEQTTEAPEKSMTTLKPNEKELEKIETSIVKSRLRRNEYYNKLQKQPIKKEEIKKENAQPLKTEEIKKENEQPLINEDIKKENEHSLKNGEDKLVDSISKPDESTLSPQESISKPAEAVSLPSEEVSTLNSFLTTLAPETNNVKASSEDSTSIKNEKENTTELSEKNQLPQL